jgi:hypothetical protein
MVETAKLLSGAHNYAVVQLPGRRFPGIVFQGDSLHDLYLRIASVRKTASKHDDRELHAKLEDIFDHLSEIVRSYEKTCEREDIDLPYPK